MIDLEGTPALAVEVRFDEEEEPEKSDADRSPLLLVAYGSTEDCSAKGVAPVARIPNRVLGAERALEIWTVPDEPVAYEEDSLLWSESRWLLAGTGSVDLEEGVAAATRRLVGQFLELLEARGYPHLLRTWYYLPGINEGDGDRERYREFNRGRAAAYAERPAGAGTGNFPASSAVGSEGSRLRAVFFAAREPAWHLSNPRQVEAFEYPRKYGPVPPTFRRATVASERLGRALFLSGTASVVGHASLHRDSTLAQLEETLRNVEIVLGAWRARCPLGPASFADLAYLKVYLRYAEELPLVENLLRRRVGEEVRCLFVEADICRRDLRIELEAVAWPRRTPR